MRKLTLETTLNYSLNFNEKKRKSKEIKFIIFHYTGMKKESDAINQLINKRSKVSSHYFIKKNGEILTLVPDLYIAWHSGISSWRNFKSINKYSIGVEISNSGILAFEKMLYLSSLIMLPVVGGMLLINVAGGIITRSAPTLNLFSFFSIWLSVFYF